MGDLWGVTVSVDENKEWSADSKALAACLEALLQLVRGQAGPAAPVANDQLRADGASRPCNPESGPIAQGARGE